MEIDLNDIDFVSLRNDLIDYYGTLAQIYPTAMSIVIDIENMSDYQLLTLLSDTTIDINDYIVKKMK